MLSLFSFAQKCPEPQTKVDYVIDVSQPYSSGVFTFEYRDTVSFSNGAIVNFCKFDQTPYTNGGNGQYNLGFIDTLTHVSYKDEAIDTVLYFIKLNDEDGVDTLGLYPSHPVGYFNAWDAISFENVDGYNKPFYISSKDGHTVRCQFFGEYSTNMKWETDSMGNGKFESEIVHSDFDFEYNYVAISKLTHVYLDSIDVPSSEKIISVEITEMPIGIDSSLSDFKSQASVITDGEGDLKIKYEFGHGLDWDLSRYDDFYDSLSYTIKTKDDITKEEKNYYFKTHIEILVYGDHVLATTSKPMLSSKIQKEIQVIDIAGRIVKTLHNITLQDIHLIDLSSGVYFAKLTDADLQFKFTIR